MEHQRDARAAQNNTEVAANRPVLPPFNLLNVTAIEVFDCGDPNGYRYVVDAVEVDPDDTDRRVAPVHIASCFNLSVAAEIKLALEERRKRLRVDADIAKQITKLREGVRS